MLSAGVLAEPPGDELAAGLLNGLCCLDRGAADLILYSLIYGLEQRVPLPCPVLCLGQFFFPLGIVPCSLSV